MKHRLFPRGFTLIELLIAIVIIGIISILGIASFQTAQKKSRDFNRKASLTAVAKALESYMSDKGVYPDASEDGKILWCGTVDNPSVACGWGEAFVDAGIEGGSEDAVYMTKLPEDPSTNQTFFYEAVDIDGMRKGYRLYARLENDMDSEWAAYEENCSADPMIPRNCTYVLTSDVTVKPTSYVTPTVTPTSEPTYPPVATPTPTTPDDITLTPTSGTKCMPAGKACSITGLACCTGACIEGICTADVLPPDE
ncbi:MAG: prepilin-type N-terminal cleavage/methylation domain-containing protein [Candidatus Thermoplasmatota archaeon]